MDQRPVTPVVNLDPDQDLIDLHPTSEDLVDDEEAELNLNDLVDLDPAEEEEDASQENFNIHDEVNKFIERGIYPS